jgi:hypothetical protein
VALKVLPEALVGDPDSNESISRFALSPDGKMLLVRGTQMRDAFLITNFW